uniref:Mitochondrial 2-oxoglutarate/malate carrier protein n=2 Tax=Graphocephala atropunctata TaxID=36148 RepID=A0A1B6MJG6_9HEMI
MSSHDNEKDQVIPGYMRFVIGGVAGVCATTIIQPLDVLKNRMQLSGEGGKKRDHSNTFQAFRNIIAKEGPRGLYQGISANILRQATYTTTRIGVYQTLVDFSSRAGYEGLSAQVSAGLLGGMIGALVGAPPDVALVRMMGDGRLPVAERRNYKHVGDALTRMVSEEGVFVLWRGVAPAMLRAMVGSVCQLVTYTQAKHYLINHGIMKDDSRCHFVSSLLAGLVYTTVSNPIDIAKTRIQTMKSVDGKPTYTGLFDVWGKTVSKEGVPSLWKGFLPYYMRMAPHTTLLLLFTEQFTYIYSVHILHNQSSHSF